MSSRSEITTHINCTEIEKTITNLADEITRDYKGKNPVVIGVLVGAFIFMADLVRKLDFPLEIDFVRLYSYGSETTSSGDVKIIMEPCIPVKGRDVIVVEDIVDTGYSLAYLIKYLKNKEPESVSLCVLTDKPSRRKVPVDITYKGFTVPDEFLVGYGLDCAQKYRNVPDICILGEKKE